MPKQRTNSRQEKIDIRWSPSTQIYMDYHACDTEHIKFGLRAQLSVTKYRGRQPRMPKQRTNPKTKYRNSRQEEKIDIRWSPSTRYIWTITAATQNTWKLCWERKWLPLSTMIRLHPKAANTPDMKFTICTAKKRHFAIGQAHTDIIGPSRLRHRTHAWNKVSKLPLDIAQSKGSKINQLG